MIKSILVPVRGDGMVATVLAHAAALAKQHDAQVNVVHCRAQPKDLMPQGIPLPDFARKVMMEQAGELANRQEDHLRGILHRLAREYGMTEEGADGAATCTFTEERGRMADVVKHAGRLSDLIVLPKPQRERNLGQSSLKAALYGAGRPVLLCPGQLQPDETFAQHVAVGWNGSLPAARAVGSSRVRSFGQRSARSFPTPRLPAMPWIRSVSTSRRRASKRRSLPASPGPSIGAAAEAAIGSSRTS